MESSIACSILTTGDASANEDQHRNKLLYDKTDVKNGIIVPEGFGLYIHCLQTHVFSIVHTYQEMIGSVK